MGGVGRMSILYLHGFRSSPASWKVRLLGEHLAARGQSERLFCPFLSHVPSEAVAQAEAIIDSRKNELTLVGSSLGGFYATALAEKHDLRAVLINPAVLSSLDPGLFIGRQTNLYSGVAFDFTSEHVAQLAALDVARVTAERYLLLVETGDEVLDYRQALARYAGCRQQVFAGGNHSFLRFPELLPQLFEYCGL